MIVSRAYSRPLIDPLIIVPRAVIILMLALYRVITPRTQVKETAEVSLVVATTRTPSAVEAIAIGLPKWEM